MSQNEQWSLMCLVSELTHVLFPMGVHGGLKYLVQLYKGSICTKNLSRSFTIFGTLKNSHL